MGACGSVSLLDVGRLLDLQNEGHVQLVDLFLIMVLGFSVRYVKHAILLWRPIYTVENYFIRL